MIHANRIVTVGEQESIIDRPIILYRGDREVEIEFTLVGNEFTFSEEGNVIKSVNASHGQLVLNTPSGEHMFSELAECHEGKVVFVVTKEMIDEFIEMGFYSFQIRLYDSAEMKSRVTIPPVMNGFDIRNPIAAEDEVNVVDQGLVDYARIFKDQSNEELPTFTWDGVYNKTEWVHHDVITENKMNKIEDALYSINANVKESDVFMLNALDNVKKDADKYVKEHMAEVEADVEEFERNLNTDVQKFKIDTNAAMTAHKNEVGEELESVNAQLEQIEKQTKVFVNIRDYEQYKVGDDWTEAINKAIEFIHTKDCFELYFPPGTYKVTKPLNSIGRVGCICGNSKLDTIIEYTPASDSTLLSIRVNTNLITYFSIKDITFKCTSKTYVVNGVVCSKGEISQNLWGAGISIEKCRVLGFTGVGIKIYAPFMSKLDTVYVGGPGYTANGDIPTGIKAVGIEMTGCEGGLNTFGNVNSIRNSMIAGCCYGLKIVSVGNINIEDTTFEPNFINVYAYRPNGNGFCDNIVFTNCWFENYNNDGHSKYGVFCIYEFNENTGDIKEGQTGTNRAGIYNNMSRVHSSCSENSLRVTHKPGGGVLHGSLIGSVEDEDEDIPILVYQSEFGTPIYIGTKYSRIHAHTAFDRGITHCYSNRNESWLASQEQHLVKWKNISTPVSGAIETIDFVIPDSFNIPEILEVNASVAIKIGGGNTMITKSECMIYNLRSIVSDTNKTTVIYNPWNDLKEIETGFKGSMLSFNSSTKTITVSVKSSGTYAINVNLELKASYITNEIK